ncbi:hypothetical protein [Nocardia testacea]|uniref:hypothetical protein n=1 Tax=Nocardia testacea TaxID=248551 RepID=UPI0002E80E5A|nr:hypothetical protein [Nocardia testacea]
MSKYLITGVMIAAFSFGAAGTAAADYTVGHYSTHGACVANGVGRFGNDELGKTWFCRRSGEGYDLIHR